MTRRLFFGLLAAARMEPTKPCDVHAKDTDSVVPTRVRRGAIGILSRGGRCLMIRRALGIPKGGCWCFPGGHVERGETSRRAVEREFHEELGIDVRAIRRLGAVRVTDSRHVLAVWRVVHTGGTLRPTKKEVDCIKWVPTGEIGTINPGLPSNACVAEIIGVEATRAFK